MGALVRAEEREPTRKSWWRRGNDNDELALPVTAHPTTEQRKADVHEAQNRLVHAQAERERLIRECDDIIEQREDDLNHAQALYAQAALDDMKTCGISYRHLAEQAKQARKPTEPEGFE